MGGELGPPVRDNVSGEAVQGKKWYNNSSAFSLAVESLSRGVLEKQSTTDSDHFTFGGEQTVEVQGYSVFNQG